MSFVYLAGPLTSKFRDEQIKRIHRTSLAAARLMKAGHVVHSPHAQSFALEVHLEELYTSHEFWMKQSLGMLSRASKLYLLPLEGWRESKGVQMELEFAAAELIPIRVLQADFIPSLDLEIPSDDSYLTSFSPFWNFEVL